MSYQDDDNRDAPPPLPPERDAYDDRSAYDDHDRFAAPAPQSGMSKGCIYVMAGCGCLTVLALIAAGVLGWMAFRWAKSAVSMDPAVIRATAQEMADFVPPAGLEPKIKMNMIFAQMVLYASMDGASQLTLIQLDRSMMGKDKKQQDAFENGFKNGLQNPQGANKRQLDVLKSELREMKIRGDIAKVTFAEAKDPSDGKEFQLIKGSFQGKGGPVEFQLQLPKEKYKEEDAIKFLESIK